VCAGHILDHADRDEYNQADDDDLQLGALPQGFDNANDHRMVFCVQIIHGNPGKIKTILRLPGQPQE
jgi:hypothetical protein